MDGLEIADAPVEAAEVAEPVETTEVESSLPDTVETRTEPAEPQTEAAEPEPVEPGTEKLPPQYSKDKFVKGLYFADRELKAAFPGGVKQAIETKRALEAIGGPEAIQEIETERAGWRQIDEDFSTGNPKLIEDWVQQAPEGFSKLVPSAMDKLKEVNPDLYNHALSKVFFNTMDQFGTFRDIRDIEYYIRQGNTEEALAALKRITNLTNTITDFAHQVPQRKVDPDKQAFEAEKAKWHQERLQDLENSVIEESNNYASSKMESQLVKEFAARNMSFAKYKTSESESFQSLMHSCFLELKNRLKKDQGSINRYNSMIQAGRKSDALNIVKSRIDALAAESASHAFRLATRIVGGAVKPEAPAQTPTQAAPAPQKSGGSIIIKLTKRPVAGQLDKLRMYNEFGKDKTDDMVYRNQGYIKGKQALYQWD